MSKSNDRNTRSKAVALQYGADDQAPVIVASGMGYIAEKIVDVAVSNGVPVYEDNSLSTVLTRLELGQEIPPELYQAVVEIYVYFLHFDPNAKEQARVPIPAAAENDQPSENGQLQNDQSEEEVQY
jgi:flagellar biosynthesis protein